MIFNNLMKEEIKKLIVFQKKYKENKKSLKSLIRVIINSK